MKQFYTFLAAVLLTATTVAQVGINNDNPDPSAALDITSSTGGLLVPRMTAAQRDAITATQGLIIFCSDCALGEGELQVNLTPSWKNIIGGDVNDPPIVVGAFYGGGVVFHLFVNGETGYVAGETHGLIAAVEDQSDDIRWWNGSYVTVGTQGAIGTGSANTDAIINVQGPIETSYAAGLARAYDGGGYDDWFLPSLWELTVMCQNRSTINNTASENGGSFNWSYYWSSSESTYGRAWFVYSGNANQYSQGNKDHTYPVRAVRAF